MYEKTAISKHYFSFLVKATKFEKISQLVLKLLSNFKTNWAIFSNFCGLLRISKL